MHGTRSAAWDPRCIAASTTLSSHSRKMAFARELPTLSEFAVAGSVLVVGDDPANRVVLTRGSGAP